MTNLEKAIEMVEKLEDTIISSIDIKLNHTNIWFNKNSDYKPFDFCNISNWNKEYIEPIIKLTKFEKNLIQIFKERLEYGLVPFEHVTILINMKELGNFKNVPDDRTLMYILDNCEVVDE